MRHYLEVLGWGALICLALYLAGCGVTAYVAAMKEWGYLF